MERIPKRPQKPSLIGHAIKTASSGDKEMRRGARMRVEPVKIIDLLKHLQARELGLLRVEHDAHGLVIMIGVWKPHLERICLQPGARPRAKAHIFIDNAAHLARTV